MPEEMFAQLVLDHQLLTLQAAVNVLPVCLELLFDESQVPWDSAAVKEHRAKGRVVGTPG